MKKYSASTRLSTKWSMFCLLFILPAVLGACVAGTHMIAKESKPAISAKPDKAVLVIIRTTSFGSGFVIDNYLDGKMIGQTQGKMFFVTDVTPGVHYVISHADNTDTARVKFEHGKIYSPMTTEDFVQQVKEATYVVYDRQHPGDDMSDKDFKEAREDFEKEVKNGEHKDTLQIKGYARLK
jgi:hypothetical protein